jgi:glutaredoxin 3
MNYYRMIEIIKNEINNNNVIIFTKKHCSYCKKAIELLDNIECKYKLIELKGDFKEKTCDDIQFILFTLTKQKTVPNIFINGEHIGGYTELNNLYEKKLLELKTTYINCSYCNKLIKREKICECLHNLKNYDDWGREL